MPEFLTVRRPRLAVLITLVFAAAMSYYHLGVFLPRSMERGVERGLGGGYSFGNDFYPIWLTSHEALGQHRNPYTPEMTREIQQGLFGRTLDHGNPGDPPADYRAFAYPAYVDVVLWPLALAGFPAARLALAIVLAGLTALSVPIWLSALRLRASAAVLAVLVLFTLSSYAAIEGLFAVQVGLLAAFLLAASFAALGAGRLLMSGSLFAFTLMKPQVSLLVAAYLLLWTFSHWHERRRFVYGFIAWFGLLLALSLLIWPHWIPDWLHIVSGYGGYSPPALIAYSLGPRLAPRIGPFLILALLCAAVAVMWRMRHREAASPAFALTVSLLLAITSITLLPGQAVYDHVILLPGILLIVWKCRPIAASSRPFTVVLAAAALAVFWQWIAAIPLLALQHFLSPAQFFGSGLYLLPFHAAVSVPLAVAAVLGYMMREEMRKPTSLPAS
jgi:hypothetical protein